jgi:hypothetical protein
VARLLRGHPDLSRNGIALPHWLQRLRWSGQEPPARNLLQPVEIGPLADILYVRRKWVSC